MNGDDAGAVLEGELDREVGGEHAGDLAGALVAVDERDRSVLLLDPRPRAAVHVAVAQALRVDDRARDPVRVGAAAVRVHERDGDGLGRSLLEPGGLEQRADPALQLGGGDPAQ